MSRVEYLGIEIRHERNFLSSIRALPLYADADEREEEKGKVGIFDGETGTTGISPV